MRLQKNHGLQNSPREGVGGGGGKLYLATGLLIVADKRQSISFD